MADLMFAVDMVLVIVQWCFLTYNYGTLFFLISKIGVI